MPELKICTNKRNVTSDAYEGMAEAVIKSAIVIVCLSADYLFEKESEFCRQEVEYAFHLKKRILRISLFESIESGQLETQVAQRLPFLGNCCAEFSGLSPSLSEWTTQLQKLVQILVEEGKTDKNSTDQIQIWLDPVDVKEDLNQYDRENVPGTCAWVPNCIEAWMADSKTRAIPKVMWLSDGAGTGKSFISYRVWREAYSNPNLLPGSAFFCKHNDVKKSEPESIVRTIAWNLCCLFPAMKAHLVNQLRLDKLAVQEGKQSILTKPGDAFERLVIDGLNVAMEEKEVDLTKKYLILVDALDECNVETRSAILKILRNSNKSFIKLFVTGRPEVDVYTAMKEADPFILELSKENTTEDIKKFVHFRLSALESWDSANPENIRSMEKCEEEINTKADSLFVYARNICQYLHDGKFSLSEALEAIQSFSSGADSVYKAILVREHKKTKPSAPSAFRRVFRVILAVRRPLDVATLRSIGHLDFHETVEVISQYRSILKVENNEVAVIHKSLYDFLTTRSRCGTVFFISLRNAETELAQNCFEILKTQLFQNMAELDGSQFYNQTSVADIMDQGKFITGAVVYAATFWGHHFVNSSYPPDLIPNLHTFCRTKLIHWLELMLIQKNLRGVILTIARVEETLMKFSENKDAIFVRLILSDVRKIAISCRIALTTSPLQVYRHALLAAPRNSEFFQTYRSYCSYEMSLGKPKTWGSLPLLGHTNIVLSTSFSKSGKLVVSGSRDMTVRVWLLETGECIQTLENVHEAAVSSVMFLDDDKSVVSVSGDEKLVLWTLETNQLTLLHPKVTRAEPPGISSASICASERYLVMGSTSGIKIWIREEHKYHRIKLCPVQNQGEKLPNKAEPPVQEQQVTAIAMCKSGDFFLTGSSPSIWCWDLSKFPEADEPSRTMTISPVKMNVSHGEKILSICISKRGAWAASTDASGDVKFCTIADKLDKSNKLPLMDETDMLNLQPFHNAEKFNCISLSPDDKILACASTSGAVLLRSLQTQTYLKTIPTHLSRAASVQMGSQGNMCVSGGYDASVRITNLSEPVEYADIPAQNTCISVSPNCKYAVCGNMLAIVTLWDLQTGKILKILHDMDWTSYVLVMNDMTVVVHRWQSEDDESYGRDPKSCGGADDEFLPISETKFQKLNKESVAEQQLASAPTFEWEEKDGWIRSKVSKELIFDLTMTFNYARYDVSCKPKYSTFGNVIAWISGNATWAISHAGK
ncbi:POC1 centriolar protein A [Chytriomyces hyalinus]|nr:POC1 centriolar protein A [Chytriomyces hyalinus]